MTKATPERLAQTMVDNLPEKTGKSLDRWLSIVAGSGLSKHGEIVRYLKAEFDVTHGYANLIASNHLNDASEPGPSALVDNQYSGAKSALKPIYDRLVCLAQGLGGDVIVAPKKTYVSLRRGKQFAIIKPSTKDRLDLGLNLKGAPAGNRLEPGGSFNAMVSHRVRLSAESNVDAELESWLRAAYDAA